MDEYCDYCEQEGHTFRTCPHRDDDFVAELVGGDER